MLRRLFRHPSSRSIAPALLVAVLTLAAPQPTAAHHRAGHDGGPPWAERLPDEKAPAPATAHTVVSRPAEGDLGPELEQHLADMERPDRDRTQHAPVVRRDPPRRTRRKTAAAPRRARRAPRRTTRRTARAPRVPYGRLIAATARRRRVPVALLTALVSQESGFQARARSHAGASGLTQLMPATARLLGVRRIFDPRQNLDGGARYLRAMLTTFRSKRLALAAYNAGPGAVRRFGGVPPYAETRNYVVRVLALERRYRRVGLR